MKVMIVDIQLRNNDDFSEHIRMLVIIFKEFNFGNSVRIIPPANNIIPFLLLATLASLLNNIDNPADLDLSQLNGGYINSLKFPNGLNINSLNSTELNDLVDSYIGKNYQPIVSLKISNSSNCSNSLLFLEETQGKLIRAQLNSLNLQDQLYESIAYIISEITDNVTNHSKSQCCNISYQFDPDLRYLDILIADNGQGLLSSFRSSTTQRFPDIIDHFSAIQAVLEKKSSKDDSIGRGFGLATSRKIITEGLGEAIKGSFFLLSGDAAFNKTGTEEEMMLPSDQLFWKGTFISIRVPVAIPSSFYFYNFME